MPVNTLNRSGGPYRLTRHPQKSVLRQRLPAPGLRVFTGETFDFYSGGDVAQISSHTGESLERCRAGRVLNLKAVGFKSNASA